FSREWADESCESAEAKSFWDAFFPVFGITRRRVALFEEPAKRLDETRGYIDLFWKGVLIVEHKSRGKHLTKAFGQAIDYLGKIPERDLPKYVLVSDFARFKLYNLETGEEHEFPLKELYENIKRFGFIAGYQLQKIREEDPVNIVAAERMGRLHDQLKASGYTGHELEVYLVRLLFCLFADDAGIFEPRARFQEYLERRTGEDGADLGYHLAILFQTLNTPNEKRQTTLDEDLASFPYVNGKLFEETLPLASFDSKMRVTLLDCAGLDWGRISPAVFGALFQSVMDAKLRRNLGAHYTSEKNILKVIKPLFLDELRAQFEKAKNSERKLFDLLKKISNLRFLDPACGCGNFLVIAYRELRLLELDILLAMQKLKKTGALDFEILKWVQVNVDQFYGIEIEEFPREIAQVAMWLTDHQMNMQVSVEFGQPFIRLPLTHAATIRHGNALRLDWNDVISAERVDYILGNPPFVGAMVMSEKQRTDIAEVFVGVKGSGVLDYVTAWYV
ncbi:MAG: N-6 DNA methylase, partial [Acidobacteria bacterium]|nr:N-6 DNA methylase [Acidobacteriota bacterium]